MKRLAKYLRPYFKECILAPAFKMLEASFELFVPLVIAAMVDRGIPQGDHGFIWTMGGVLVLLGVVGLAASLTAQFFSAKAAVGFSADLRCRLLAHIQKLSYSQLDRQGLPALITRMTSDINQIQNGVNLTLRLLLRSPFVVFGAMIMAFTIDFDAALPFAVMIAALCVVVFGIMLWTMPKYKKVQSHLDDVTGSTQENLSGVRVIRAFCQEDAQEEEFRRRNDALTRAQTAVGRISGAMGPVTFLLVNLSVIWLLHTGALRVNEGGLTSGQVLALYNYMSQILVELIKMANLIITMTKAAACASRVAAVLDLTPDQTAAGQTPDGVGHVRFEDVALRYNPTADEALSHISFTAEPGQTIGILGGTGSGKSSLVNLIPRFYDATAGLVLVDGTDVKAFDPGVLRRRCGVVPQKAVLMSGTVRSNLLWGNPDASDEELWQALETAQAADVVRSKEGLDTVVEQGGRNFSGGQRQRLTIARALVRKPSILILDDSASALDYATDAALRKAIRAMAPAPTTFIVSQRASSVRYADQILVLEDGELVARGTHDELLAASPVYREIFNSQFEDTGVEA